MHYQLNTGLYTNSSSDHTSKVTKNTLEGKNIDVIDWPGKYSNLNIIEDVWGP